MNSDNDVSQKKRFNVQDVRRVAGAVTVVLLAGGLIWAVPQLLGIANGDVDVAVEEPSDPNDGVAGADGIENDGQGAAGDDPTAYNATKVERHFLRLYNDERESQGMAPVERSDQLFEMGMSHAENMRTHDYVGHDQPDGTTIEDRFRSRDLLPRCKIPTGEGSVYFGAENAAGASVTRPSSPEHLDVRYNINSNEELAEYLFDGWITSPPHRRAMMQPNVRSIGLGVAINSEGYVYAALEMCGAG